MTRGTIEAFGEFMRAKAKSGGELAYPVSGGCVFCSYAVGSSTSPVPAATARIMTRKGPRDLCQKHAAEPPPHFRVT